MKAKKATIALLITLMAGAAYADDDCAVPMADWQSREAVRVMVESRGWHLHRVKIDDGCYEVRVSDAEGRHFEAIVNPATLEIIEIEKSHHHP